MNKLPTPLPEGIYAFSAEFREKEGEVCFVFRGVTYSANVGVNAFGHLTQAAAAADRVPAVPFCGRSYAVPVILIPAGEHKCPLDRAYLPVKLARPVALLGEAVGVSPNAPDDVRRPNPARTMPESVLVGAFYWGTLSVTDGYDGVLVLDGLLLRDTTVRDGRSAGQSLGVEVRNCIFENSFDRDLISAAPLSDAASHRRMLVSDCRADGIDSRDSKGRFLVGRADEWTVERVYYAHTRKFFGLSDYGRTDVSAAPGGSFRLTLRGLVAEQCDCLHGISIALPKDAAGAEITAEDCVFDGFASVGDPVFHVSLPNKNCRLTLRRCKLAGEGELAIMVDGPEDAAVTLEDTEVSGYAASWGCEPPRRTGAPEKIGQVVWPDERLDDPHAPCEDTEEALRWLDLLYDGRDARFGDMHVHTNSGGTSDGATPLGEFVRQLKAMGLDFAAVVDHKQIRHAFLPEWDDELLICGTEPGTIIEEEGRPERSAKLHYTLIFRRPSDYFRLAAAFPEFKITEGPDGHIGYPRFTPERFRDMGEFVYHLGGTMAHAHPKQLMASDDPLHFYFGDRVPLETILGNAESYNTIQNVRLWEALLKMGKRVHTRGDSDSHQQAKNCALTSTYTHHRNAAEVLEAVRDGDCAAGCIGIQMALGAARMGSHLPWRQGLKLAVRLKDYYRPGMKEDTVYCLKVFTDRGLAWASEFDGAQPQALVLPAEKRLYYRVEVTNESDGAYVAVSNPIWLD